MMTEEEIQKAMASAFTITESAIPMKVFLGWEDRIALRKTALELAFIAILNPGLLDRAGRKPELPGDWFSVAEGALDGHHG